MHVFDQHDHRRRCGRHFIQHRSKQNRAISAVFQQGFQFSAGFAGDVVQRAERVRGEQRFARAPQVTSIGMRLDEMLEQCGFADAGFAANEHGTTVARCRRFQIGRERRQKLLAFE